MVARQQSCKRKNFQIFFLRLMNQRIVFYLIIQISSYKTSPKRKLRREEKKKKETIPSLWYFPGDSFLKRDSRLEYVDEILKFSFIIQYLVKIVCSSDNTRVFPANSLPKCPPPFFLARKKGGRKDATTEFRLLGKNQSNSGAFDEYVKRIWRMRNEARIGSCFSFIRFRV